ncbi:MAG TPA: response regulator transcription factor [Actinomycetota bacterium]|nr:response regulator transcription factor [Actinomycetota bacterium]
MNANSVKVLIVDDQAPFRDVARLVVDLTDGFEVAGEAQTGEESVEMARSLKPDLILMDVNMPGIDGTEATKIILGESDDVVVLLLSTYEPAEYEPRAVEAGAAAYIPKSAFDPDRLEAAWKEARASRSGA